MGLDTSSRVHVLCVSRDDVEQVFMHCMLRAIFRLPTRRANLARLDARAAVFMAVAGAAVQPTRRFDLSWIESSIAWGKSSLQGCEFRY